MAKGGFTFTFDSIEFLFYKFGIDLQQNKMYVHHNKRPNMYLQIHIIIFPIKCWVSNSFKEDVLF
jgi:hypothetical protein